MINRLWDRSPFSRVAPRSICYAALLSPKGETTREPVLKIFGYTEASIVKCFARRGAVLRDEYIVTRYICRGVIMARRRCFLPPRPAKVDEAAIGRILHPFRDWRCTGCNHKTFTTRAETVAPPLSSSGSYFLVVDRNKKLQNCGRKRCKSAGAKKTASHYWSLEVPIKLSRPEPSIEGGSLGRLAVSRSVFATRSEYGAVIAGRRRDGHDQALLWSHRAGIQGSALNAKPAGPGTCRAIVDGAVR